MSRPKKEPIYTLPHGIEVIGEYAPNDKCPYWRVRVRPHPMIPGKVISDGVYTRRCRVIATAMLGRKLERNEHVHHTNHDRTDDRPENLEVLAVGDHNRLHKVGFQHSEETKKRISGSLRAAISQGLREPPPPGKWLGRKHSEAAKKKMSETKRKLIASGQIKPGKPPSPKGREVKVETKEKQSVFAKSRPRNESGRFL